MKKPYLWLLLALVLAVMAIYAPKEAPPTLPEPETTVSETTAPTETTEPPLPPEPQYPELSRHVPFLFPDENGNLRPDAALTSQEFNAALEALAEPEVREAFPTLPIGKWDMETKFVRLYLAKFFPEEALDQAMKGTGEEMEWITRQQFARVMNTLLDRKRQSVWAVPSKALYPDVRLFVPGWEDLMEAAAPHVHDLKKGKIWAEAVYHEPGFFHQDGYLYHADGAGTIARNTWVGSLYFGMDGRYTSGDRELDDIVAGLLSRFMAENPEAEELELLEIAFNYCRDSFFYLRKEPLYFGQTDWETSYAKSMFTDGYGNCYNYAASFWSLARGLGYDARTVSGLVSPNPWFPHGWVMIPFDGTEYIFDAELEMVYLYEREIYWRDMFMLSEYTAVYDYGITYVFP